MTKQAKKIVPNPNVMGRPKGSKNRRTIIREALQQHYPEGELGFWLSVAEIARGGDMQAAAMIADRLYPKLKPQTESVTLPEPLDGTSAEMARQLVQMAGRGDISPSVAQELLKALSDVLRIVEIDELSARIAALEEQQP